MMAPGNVVLDEAYQMGPCCIKKKKRKLSDSRTEAAGKDFECNISRMNYI